MTDFLNQLAPIAWKALYVGGAILVGLLIVAARSYIITAEKAAAERHKGDWFERLMNSLVIPATVTVFDIFERKTLAFKDALAKGEITPENAKAKIAALFGEACSETAKRAGPEIRDAFAKGVPEVVAAVEAVVQNQYNKLRASAEGK